MGTLEGLLVRFWIGLEPGGRKPTHFSVVDVACHTWCPPSGCQTEWSNVCEWMQTDRGNTQKQPFGGQHKVLSSWNANMHAMSPCMHIQPITRSQGVATFVKFIAAFFVFGAWGCSDWCGEPAKQPGVRGYFLKGPDILQILLSGNLSESFWIFSSFFHSWFACRYWITENPQVLDCRGRAIAIVDTWPKGLFQFDAPVSACMHAWVCVQCAGAFVCNARGHFECVCVWMCGCVRACWGMSV